MIFLLWSAWWAFQRPPMFVISLVQTQPISRWAGPASARGSRCPDRWLVSYDDYEHIWSHQYVDQPLSGGHVLYLVGLIVLCVGSALRVRSEGAATEPTVLRRRLRSIGWASLAGGILIQLWPTGFALIRPAHRPAPCVMPGSDPGPSAVSRPGTSSTSIDGPPRNVWDSLHHLVYAGGRPGVRMYGRGTLPIIARAGSWAGLSRDLVGHGAKIDELGGLGPGGMEARVGQIHAHERGAVQLGRVGLTARTT